MGQKNTHFLVLALFVSIWTGCTANRNLASLASPSPSPSVSTSPTPTATTTVSGARAAKFIFKLAVNGGSFPTPSSLGTPALAGSGLQATTVFNTDGSVLSSSGPTGTNWPSWITSFEIGVSGSANSSSQNENCARFAESSESSLTNCSVGPSPTPASCGAPVGQFRVSEVDCSVGTPLASTGNGSGTDGVYFRVQFSRDTDKLALNENILVVIEYVASALNPAPANPTSCFSSTDGTFSPETCSDFVWRAYLKHSASETVQPFLLLVPPTYSSILAPGTTAPANSGTGVTSKQFILPMAGDSTLSVLQISRTQSNFPSTSNLLTYCTSSGAVPGNSPLCAGILFYSITFYRI